MAFQTDPSKQTAAIKFMSLVHRHRPKMLGIELEEGGWAPVSVLLDLMNRRGFPIDLDDLPYVVEHNDKSRFTLTKPAIEFVRIKGTAFLWILCWSRLLRQTFCTTELT